MQVTDFLAVKPIAKSWFAQDSSIQFSVNDPVWNTVIADSGQLVNGYYDLLFGVAGNASHFYFDLEHRNSLNNATVERFHFSILAYETCILHLESHYLVHNERFRIIVINNAIGDFIGNLLWYRRSYDP